MGDSAVLFEAAFMQRVGVLAVPGQLTLTRDQLAFTPDALERFAGAKPWTLQPAHIESIRCVGLERAVRVHTASGPITLHGKYNLLLYARLEAWLRQHQGDHSLTPESEDERTVLFGPAIRYRNHWFAANGTVELTTRVLRFIPTTLSLLLAGAGAYEVELDAITDVRLTGRRRTLEIRHEHDLTRIGGALAGEIYASLTALRDDLAGRGVRSRNRKALLRRGPLAHPGRLIVSPARVSFVTTGSIDSMVGLADDFDIALSELRALRIDDGNLVLSRGADAFELEFDDADRCLDEIALLIRLIPSESEPATNPSGAYIPTLEQPDPLASWRVLLDEAAIGNARLSGPALLYEPGLRASRIHLIQGESSVMIVADSGDEEGEFDVIRYEDEGIAWQEGELQRDVIQLRKGDRSVRVVPRGGNEFVRLFWAGVLKRERLDASPPRPAVRPVHTIRDADGNRRDAYRVSIADRIVSSLKVLSLPPALEYLAQDGDTSLAAILPGNTLEYALLDISADGLGVSMHSKLPEGTEVLVYLPEGPERFPVHAKVQNERYRPTKTRPHAMGLTIIDGSPEQRVRMQRLWATLQLWEAARHRDVRSDE